MRAPLLIGGLGVGAAVLVFALLLSPSPQGAGSTAVEEPAEEGVDLGDRAQLRARLRDLKARTDALPEVSAEPIDPETLQLSPEVRAALDRLPEEERQRRLRKYQALRNSATVPESKRAQQMAPRAAQLRGKPFWDAVEKRQAMQAEVRLKAQGEAD